MPFRFRKQGAAFSLTMFTTRLTTEFAAIFAKPASWLMVLVSGYLFLAPNVEVAP